MNFELRGYPCGGGGGMGVKNRFFWDLPFFDPLRQMVMELYVENLYLESKNLPRME